MTCNDLEEKANELYERVENYCNSIINGDIPACKKHIQACKRFYKFKENRNYYFDKLELLKVYIWARQFKHTKGVLAGKNIELVEIIQELLGKSTFKRQEKMLKLKKWLFYRLMLVLIQKTKSKKYI